MNTSLLSIQSPGAHRPRGLAVMRLGFRPFYLCAAMLAFVNAGWWALISVGLVTWSSTLPPMLWHAHEMLFGFAAAVITGFLFTAGKNWTQLQTPRGPMLAALVLLWVVARCAALLASPTLFMVIDLALLPTVALILLRVLVLAGNRRNIPLVGILLLLALANLAFHLTATGALSVSILQPLRAALALVVLMELVMGGRVIPGFTMSSLPSVRIAPMRWLDFMAIGLSAMGLLMWVMQISPAATGSILLAAGLANLLRLARWQSWKCLSLPMLWILHTAYLWIPIGLILLAMSELGSVATSLGVHALAVGATGGLILGMITRTARGHTGRTLTPTRTEVLAFACVMSAAFVRVVPLLRWPAAHNTAVLASAFLWCLAFGLYLWKYVPWLLSTRVDGRDG